MESQRPYSNQGSRLHGVQFKIQSIEDKISVPASYQTILPLSEKTPTKRDTPKVLVDCEKAFDGKGNNQKETFNRCKIIPIKFLMTGEMAKYYSRETYFKTSLKEALFHGVFLTVLSILVFEHSSSDTDMFIISMVDKFILCEIDNRVTLGGLTFIDINTIDQLWVYLNTLLRIFHESNFLQLSSNLSSTDNFDHKSEFHDNALVGLPRLKTVRVQNESCEVAKEFKKQNPPCFNYYSSTNEDTEPFGLKSGPAWYYKSATETGMDYVNGMVNFYSGGGFCQDCPKSLNEFKKILYLLKTGKWIDRATRAVTVDFTIYNVNLDIFAIMKLLFEIPPTGGVITSYTIKSLKTTEYNSKNMIYLGCILLFLTLILFYTLQELCELMYFKWNFFVSFCNILDLGVVIMGYFVITTNVQKNLVLKGYLKEIVSYDLKFANFSHILHTKETCDMTESVLVFLSWIKLLKYMHINHSIYRLQITLQMCLKNVLWYSIIFIYILFIFSFTACNIFGNQIEPYHTLSSSFWTILHMGTRDFHYNRFQESRPYLGPIFYLFFLYSMCLIFVVVYIAILLDSYKETAHKTSFPSDRLKVGDVLKNCLEDLVKQFSHKLANRLRYNFNKRKIQKEFHGVQNLLKRYGFRQIEIDTFLEKYQVSEDKVITNEELHTIRKHLQKRETSKVHLVQKIVRQNVAEKLTALEEAVSNANKNIVLMLQMFDLIETKVSLNA